MTKIIQAMLNRHHFFDSIMGDNLGFV